MKIVKAKPLHHYQLNSGSLTALDKFLVKPNHDCDGFYTRMFNEDFSRIFRPNTRRTCAFEIESNDDELLRKLLINVGDHYRGYDLDTRVLTLVEQIAQSLTYFGQCNYFIHGEGDIHIVPLSPSGIYSLYKLYFQYLPPRVDHEAYGSVELSVNREIRILDRKRLMTFVVPKRLNKILSKQKRYLSVLDNNPLRPEVFVSSATYDNPDPVHHFDFKVWQDIEDTTLYKGTVETGWNARKYSDSNLVSDFFSCHRMIRFRRNQLIFRDSIISQLSSELTKIGCLYNDKFALSIRTTEELPQVAKFDELEQRLKSEDASFDEILDAYFENSSQSKS